MSASGQSVTDRINAAKHSLTGQGLAKAVCKSTTEEVAGPKRKHLDYLLQCTHETNVSVPQMADLLIQRTQTTNWVVVFKSLITVHNVMNYGSERYMQYMASNTVFSNLDSFNDRTTPQGYDMSTYIRKYAKYINEKATAYRLMAFDFCKVKRGKDDGLLRTMVPEKLLKALPVLQDQIDALLEFDPTLNELNNGVINAAFLLLFKDLIRLFACYNDGIINLLEKYFDMNRKQCKEALEIYKKFLVRMDQTGEFLKVAENVGIDKGDIPDLTKAPASLLEALEAHLRSLEGRKAAKLPAGTQKVGGAILNEEDKKKLLAEEEKELQRMKSPGDKPKKAKKKKKERKEKAQTLSAHMEAASHVPAQQTTQVIPPQAPAAVAPAAPAVVGAAAAAPASDDLLALDMNPFQAKTNNVLSVVNSQPQQWMSNPLDPMSLSPKPNQPAPGSFTSEMSFASAFGTTPSGAMPGMLHQPMAIPIATSSANQQKIQADLIGLDIDAAVSSDVAADEKAEPSACSAEEPPATAPAEQVEATTKEEVVAESCEAAITAEPVPDLLTSDDNILCVTIGGQSISINTRPSGQSESGENSVEGSPEPGRRSPSPNDLKPDDAGSKEEKRADAPQVADLLADFSQPAEPEPAAEQPLNADIMDLLGGLEVVAPPVSPSLQGATDVVSMEDNSPAVMLLPTSERSITPSPSIVNPNQAGNELTDLSSADPNGGPASIEDIQPSPAYIVKSLDAPISPQSSPQLSPKPSPKLTQNPPAPKNSLEAAMFKQLFPEETKVVVRKSLAEMRAESSGKSSGSSPAMSHRDSHGEQKAGHVLLPERKEDQGVSNDKLLKNDLDSSLASLTDSKLIVSSSTMKKGNLQWGPEQPKKMTGGQNYNPGMTAATSTWVQPQQPMSQPMFMPMQAQPQYQPYPQYPQQNFTPFMPPQMAPPVYQAQQMPTLQPTAQPQTSNTQPDLFSM